MPIEFLYLGVVFAVAIVCFSILKRPLYECMLISFIALVLVTGTLANVGTYIWDALQEPTLYVIFVFILSAALLSKTTVIDDCIAIILSIFGGCAAVPVLLPLSAVRIWVRCPVRVPVTWRPPVCSPFPR